MPTSANDSIIFFDVLRFPYGSNYGMRETLTIPTGQIVQGANGQAVNLANPTLRLYALTYNAPAVVCLPTINAIWQGQAVGVSVGQEITARIAVGGTTATLDRTPVTGTTRAELADGTPLAVGLSGLVATIATQSQDTYVFYRPQLSCVITSINSDFDEYSGTYSWSVTLQEVAA